MKKVSADAAARLKIASQVSPQEQTDFADTSNVNLFALLFLINFNPASVPGYASDDAPLPLVPVDCAKSVLESVTVLPWKSPIKFATISQRESVVLDPKGQVFLLRANPNTAVTYFWTGHSRSIQRVEVPIDHRATFSDHQHHRLPPEHSPAVERAIKALIYRNPRFPSLESFPPAGIYQMKSPAFAKVHRTSDVVVEITRDPSGRLTSILVQGIDKYRGFAQAPDGLHAISAKGRIIKLPRNTLEILESAPPLSIGEAMALRNRVIRAENKRRLAKRIPLDIMKTVYFPHIAILKGLRTIAMKLVTGRARLKGPVSLLPFRILKDDGAHLSGYFILLYTGLHPNILAVHAIEEQTANEPFYFNQFEILSTNLEPLRKAPTVVINGLDTSEFLHDSAQNLYSAINATERFPHTIEANDLEQKLEEWTKANGPVQNLTLVGHGFETTLRGQTLPIRGMIIGGVRYVEDALVASTLNSLSHSTKFQPISALPIGRFLAPGVRIDLISCQLGKGSGGDRFADQFGKSHLGDKGGTVLYSTLSIIVPKRSFTEKMAHQLLVEMEEEQRISEILKYEPSWINQMLENHLVQISPWELGEAVRILNDLEPRDPHPVKVFRFDPQPK